MTNTLTELFENPAAVTLLDSGADMVSVFLELEFSTGSIAGATK